MPPPWRNHRLPTACDTPTSRAASSGSRPLAISHQNSRSTSRRCDGAPDDFIGDRPVNAAIHRAGLPIDTSTLEVSRRPVESAQFTSRDFRRHLSARGITNRRGGYRDQNRRRSSSPGSASSRNAAPGNRSGSPSNRREGRSGSTSTATSIGRTPASATAHPRRAKHEELAPPKREQLLQH